MKFALLSISTSLLLFVGCANERAERKSMAIANGTLAPSETSIFLMEPKDGSNGVRCTGVLVTPHLLLTAAHCFSGEIEGVDCAKDRLGVPSDFTKFRFTNLADTSSAPPSSIQYFSAKAVAVPEGELLCGNDWALVEFSEAVASSTAKPTEASFEPVKASSVSLRAVGYGAGHFAGTGEGVKRSSGYFDVICVGDACEGKVAVGVAGGGAMNVPETTALEFSVSVGACPGDSGGALFDESATLRGIVSRGTETCGPSIATSITLELARKIAELAEKNGDEIPAWTAEPAVVPLPPFGGAGGTVHSSGGYGAGGGSATECGGCRFGVSNDSNIGSFSSLLMFGALALRRMKRTMTNRKCATLPLVALLSLGCTRNLTDTEGRHFTETCEGDACEFHEKGDTSANSFRLQSAESVLSICPKESKAIHECRALVCESNRDCSAKGERFVCADDGVCRHESRKRTKKDKIVECQSGLGPWTGNGAQRERLTLARACDEGCELPAVCRMKK